MELWNLFIVGWLLAAPAVAQFNFFDQMFGGGHEQHHQQPQNMPSDSVWYKQQYEAGEDHMLKRL